MKKSEFIEALRGRLQGIPREDLEERLAFYEEMIDDRIEDGLSEEEALAAVGSVESVAEAILQEQLLLTIACSSRKE